MLPDKKQKRFFKTKDLARPGKSRLSGLISKIILKLVIPDHTMTAN